MAMADAIHRAVWWCSRFSRYARQRHHVAFEVSQLMAVFDPPPLAGLLENIPRAPPQRPRTDDALDIEEMPQMPVPLAAPAAPAAAAAAAPPGPAPAPEAPAPAGVPPKAAAASVVFR